MVVIQMTSVISLSVPSFTTHLHPYIFSPGKSRRQHGHFEFRSRVFAMHSAHTGCLQQVIGVDTVFS
jgi:hypothetical protein